MDSSDAIPPRDTPHRRPINQRNQSSYRDNAHNSADIKATVDIEIVTEYHFCQEKYIVEGLDDAKGWL